jgi:hypothetical protein
MTREIWKFSVPIGPDCRIAMPLMARVLQVGHQHAGSVCFWAEVCPQNTQTARTFRVVGTGQTVPKLGTYVGTTQDPPFVWHLFELSELQDEES